MPAPKNSVRCFSCSRWEHEGVVTALPSCLPLSGEAAFAQQMPGGVVGSAPVSPSVSLRSTAPSSEGAKPRRGNHLPEGAKPASPCQGRWHLPSKCRRGSKVTSPTAAVPFGNKTNSVLFFYIDCKNSENISHKIKKRKDE